MTAQPPEQRTPDHVSFGGWIVRGIALAIFLPPRLLWEAVKFVSRTIARSWAYFLDHLLEPTAKLLRDWVFRPGWKFVKNYLWRWLIQHVLWSLVLTPLGALLVQFVLQPFRHVIEQWVWRLLLRPGLILLFRVLEFAITWLIVRPAGFLWRRLLRPGFTWLTAEVLDPAVHALGRGLGFCYRWFLRWPARMCWRWILRPLIYAFVVSVLFGWRIATIVTRILVITPCRRLYRTVLQPLAAATARLWRDHIARPARWTYRTIIQPMSKRASEMWTLVFGR
ncbi:hypothetical protein [Nocardia sp. NPDC020380]|uniref:hypothetical protein n=1 Tax=Nocardia sp. NPDC020380 TaxID=3364309 RepID=UPI00378F9A8B